MEHSVILWNIPSTLFAARPESSFLSLGFVYKRETNPHVTRNNQFYHYLFIYVYPPQLNYSKW
jgi:hypothetical protein